MHGATAIIEVEATGDDPARDEILHVAAAVSDGAAPRRRFEARVRPRRPLPPALARRLGVGPDWGRDAPGIEEALSGLRPLLDGCRSVVSFRPRFAKAVLQGAGAAQADLSLFDLAALSRTLFPRVAAHNPFSLGDALGLPPPRGAGALARCELALAVWAKVTAAAGALPADLVCEINRLLTPCRTHALYGFFRDLDGQPAAARRRNTAAVEDLFPREPAARVKRDPADPSAWQKLDLQEVAALLGPEGPFAASIPRYEHREQQVEMAVAVAEALNEKRCLMVEAGTGVGKSLAYLVPSILWAVRNRTPVVISTNTKNLQSQLFQKDLPLLAQAAPVPFRAAVIKGRGNYLCLRKLFHLLRQADAELDPDERAELVRVLPWAAGSDSGDLSEIGVGEGGGLGGLHQKLTSSSEECRGGECRYRPQCFLQRARRRAMAADVVVANHAVVFSEMGLASPVLPPYAHVVFDEAHNLEEAATNWLTVEVSLPRMRHLLGRLWRPGRRSRGTGLIPSALRMVASGTVAGEGGARERVEQLGAAIEAAIAALDPALEEFGDALGGVLGGPDAREARRYGASARAGGEWQGVPRAQGNLLSGLKGLADAVGELAKALTEMAGGTLFERLEVVQELQAIGLRLVQLHAEIQFVLAGEDEGFVYWIGRAPGARGGAFAMAAPIDVGPKLAEELYSAKASVIFTSATLSVNSSMDFLRRRIGVSHLDAERVAEKRIGTPFDYPAQCAAVVPLFLPEPEEPGRDYASELGWLLAALFRRTRGRGMCLFTSYDMLRRTTAALEQELGESGLPVLAQGISGSREIITEEFRRDVESVLMGTHSFWEGVDIVGESLSCLVVARLPFGVITDPVLEARCERLKAEGGNPFVDYQLPQAVIKFRQGFGRLIRSRSDRGVVVVADRRILTKRYGGWFRGAIPVPAGGIASQEEFLDAVSRFLESC